MKKIFLSLNFLFLSLSFQVRAGSTTGKVKLRNKDGKRGILLTKTHQNSSKQENFYSKEILEKEQVWFKRLRRTGKKGAFEVEIVLSAKKKPKELLLIGEVEIKQKNYFVTHPLYKMKIPLTARTPLKQGDKISFQLKLDQEKNRPKAIMKTLFLEGHKRFRNPSP